MAPDVLADKWPLEKCVHRHRWLIGGNEQRFEVLVRLLAGRANIKGAEVGVRSGETSLHLLKNLPGLMSLVVVDPWTRTKQNRTWKYDDPREAFLAFWDGMEPYKDKVIILRKNSTVGAQDIPDNLLDFVFIDANHYYPCVKEDIAAWVPKVKDGGLIAGHDYISLKLQHTDVKQAVDEMFGNAVELAGDMTWYVWKGRVAQPAPVIPPKPEQKRALWWCNGGIGDACMMAAGINALATSEFLVDFYPQRTAPRMVGELIGRLPGVTVLAEKPTGPYDVVCCDCGEGTLKERTAGIPCSRLVTPKERNGTPRDWAVEIARLAGANTNALNNSKRAVFAEMLPHARRPNVVCFGTGVGGTTEVNKEKRWPDERWDKLCHALSAWPQVWIGAGDAYVPPAPEGLTIRNLCGKTENLSELLPIFAECALYIGVDNGLGHLAAACGVPTLSIFGATDVQRYRPWGTLGITVGEHGRFPDVLEVATLALGFLGGSGPC